MARSYVEFTTNATRRYRVLRDGWSPVRVRPRQIVIGADGQVDVTESPVTVRRWRLLLLVYHQETDALYGNRDQLGDLFEYTGSMTAKLPDRETHVAVRFEGDFVESVLGSALEGAGALFVVPVQLVQVGP